MIKAQWQEDSMLKKFSVENFKGFQSKFVLDLSRPGNYAFNPECVKNGIVSKAAIYGINGIGKSNLGLAIFDIVTHLTEKYRPLNKYTNYLNLDGSKPYVYFEYVFQFENNTLVYKYAKQSLNTLIEESLSINDKEMLYYDFRENKGFSNFLGSETLDLSSNSSNSRVKYIMGTALLKADNLENTVLSQFKEFVENMLLFYSLRENEFIGFRQDVSFLDKLIIDANKVQDFENFINAQGLKIKLVVVNSPEGKKIYFQHKHGLTYYFNECSTGMVSLILLYSWLIQIEKCSFVYIDEFDAFYHYELAEMIVKELKKFKDVQIIVTTHNTDLLNNDLMRPDCYFVLTEEKIDSLNRLTEKDLRLAHNLQKLFKSGAFNE